MGSCTSQPVDESHEPDPNAIELPPPGHAAPDMRYRQPGPTAPTLAGPEGRRGSEPGSVISPPSTQQGRGKQPQQGRTEGKGKRRAGGGGATKEEQDFETIKASILSKTKRVLEAGKGKGGLVNEDGYMEAKILLLGSGESGKSTILKQMKILHGDGFSHAELMQYRQIIRHNLVDSAQALLRVILQWGYQPDLGELPAGWDSGAGYADDERWLRERDRGREGNVMENLPGTTDFSVPIRVPEEREPASSAGAQAPVRQVVREEQVSFSDMIRLEAQESAAEERGYGYAKSVSSKKSKKRPAKPAEIDSPHGPSGGFQLGWSGPASGVPPLPGGGVPQEGRGGTYDPLHARSMQSISQSSTVSDYAYPSSPTTSMFQVHSDRAAPPRPYGSQPTIMSTTTSGGGTGGSAETVQALLGFRLQEGRTPPLWVAEAIGRLWGAQGFMREVLRRSNEFYLMDNAPYFFKHARRICETEYWPTNQDVLRCRVQTRGVTQSSFTADGMRIHMFDVGGQRAERKKWIVAFESVKCVIFTAALSEYDQMLLESPGQNRMQESIQLFKNIITSRWFQKTTIVMFFNKMDVFEEKYHRSPLKSYFAEYSGNDVESGVKFIIWKYRQVNRNNVGAYSHITTATDTNRCKVVLAAVRENILDAAIRDSGLI